MRQPLLPVLACLAACAGAPAIAPTRTSPRQAPRVMETPRGRAPADRREKAGALGRGRRPEEGEPARAPGATGAAMAEDAVETAAAVTSETAEDTAPAAGAAPGFDPARCPKARATARRRALCGDQAGLRARCRRGEAAACGRLGDCHADRGAAGLAPAIALYRHACEGGDGHGCLQLGRLLTQGRGLPRDRPAAWRHMRRACALGDADGCAGAGLLRYLGVGVDKQEDEAATLLETGCRGGSASACLQLGILHARGAPRALIPRSGDRALALYRRACALCQPKACHLAAHHLRARPEGGPEAALLRARACLLGHAAACPAALASPGRGPPKPP